MHVFLALIFIFVCGGAIVRGVLRPGPLPVFVATLSLFSIGYYGLPMLLIERSTLRYLPDAEVSAPILMALLFLVAVLIGISLVTARSQGIKGLKFAAIDAELRKRWWLGMIVCNGLVIFNNATRIITFYQVDSVEVYLAGQSTFEGALRFLVGIAQALAALYFTIALRERSRRKIIASGLGILLQVAVVITAGQRLVFIMPLVSVMAALVVQQQYRTAGTTLGVTIAALLIISPFAVALRSGVWNNQQDVVAANFTYGEDPIDTMLQSIVDRGDILQNMVALKGYVDTHGRVNATYYYSVLVLPIPRVIYKAKPYVLSDTGTLDGESSILAWRLLVGPTVGSLTAFGSIIAYREGGWLWVPVNGLLTGMLFAYLLTMFSRGNAIGQAFYIVGFTNWSIAKVPPSLMETMVLGMTYLPVIVALYILNRLLEGRMRIKLDDGSVAHLG